jgi:hypothetical protein
LIYEVGYFSVGTRREGCTTLVDESSFILFGCPAGEFIERTIGEVGSVHFSNEQNGYVAVAYPTFTINPSFMELEESMKL